VSPSIQDVDVAPPGSRDGRVEPGVTVRGAGLRAVLLLSPSGRPVGTPNRGGAHGPGQGNLGLGLRVG
jgi:hypothetical protein